VFTLPLDPCLCALALTNKASPVALPRVVSNRTVAFSAFACFGRSCFVRGRSANGAAAGAVHTERSLGLCGVPLGGRCNRWHLEDGGHIYLVPPFLSRRLGGCAQHVLLACAHARREHLHHHHRQTVRCCSPHPQVRYVSRFNYSLAQRLRLFSVFFVASFLPRACLARQ
jgi:hypothetical protein